jgi:hypothetical protein
MEMELDRINGREGEFSHRFAKWERAGQFYKHGSVRGIQFLKNNFLKFDDVEGKVWTII